MKKRKVSPIVPHAVVTPIDTNHPWFMFECVVSLEVDDEHVLVRLKKAELSRPRRFKKTDLAFVHDASASGIADTVGKQMSRQRRRS